MNACRANFERTSHLCHSFAYVQVITCENDSNGDNRPFKKPCVLETNLSHNSGFDTVSTCTPAVNMDPLMYKRKVVYVERWIERHNFSGGWIINSRNSDWHWHQEYDKLINETLKDYNQLDEVTYGKLKAILYKKK